MSNNDFLTPDIASRPVPQSTTFVVPEVAATIEGSPEQLAEQWRNAPAIPRLDIPEPTAVPGFSQAPFDYAPPAPYNFPPPPISKAIRPGTIVWGFIISALGVLVLLSAAGVVVDVSLVFIWLLAAAGVALIASAISSAIRRSISSGKRL